MTKFRPCIDLHSGQVKQIVGGTLSPNSSNLKTNYVSPLPASHFANLYKKHTLTGAHVIMLGTGNEMMAIEALEAWPKAFQVGGGINEDNAHLWIDRGAEKVSRKLDGGTRGADIISVGYCHLISIPKCQILHQSP
jgi:phosphoribosylformimino-5-aminoimidazole carboxamide ribotide isomerase